MTKIIITDECEAVIKKSYIDNENGEDNCYYVYAHSVGDITIYIGHGKGYVATNINNRGKHWKRLTENKTVKISILDSNMSKEFAIIVANECSLRRISKTKFNEQSIQT